MKKLSIVLLAFLFVAGSLFAAELTVEGDVTASVSADLDNSTFGFDGYDDSDVDADFDINLASGSAASSGEGDLYAVIEGSASLDIMFPANGQITYDESVTGVDYNDDGDTDDEFTVPFINSSVGVDTFDIYAGDFVIDLLGAPSDFSNAASFDFDYDGDDDTYPIDKAEGAFEGKNGGVSVSYQDYTVGLDFFYEKGAADELLYLVYGGVSQTVAEGLDVSAAAAIDKDGFDATVAGSYVVTDLGTVNLALDAADNFGAFDASADMAFEQIADMLTPELAVYFYNDGTDSDLYIHTGSEVAMDFGDVAFNFDAKTLLTSWDLFADASTTIDAITVSVEGSYDKAKEFSVGGGVDYVYDVWTVSAGAGYNRDVLDEGETDTIDFNAGVETGSLINNATVGLSWETDDIANEVGVITASVTASL